MEHWGETFVETPHGRIREFGPPAAFSDHASRFMIEHLEVPTGAIAAEPGCGTGVLSIYMALAGARRVTGTDIDKNSILAARHNASINGTPDVQFIEGSLLEPLQEKLDLVVALLPHKPAPRPFDQRYYGGADGTDLLRAMVLQASERLMTGGHLYLYLNSIANPPRVLASLAERFSFTLAAEKKRYFTREEFDTLTPGMFDYLCELRDRDMAQFDEDESGLYFMARIYDAVRS